MKSCKYLRVCSKSRPSFRSLVHLYYHIFSKSVHDTINHINTKKTLNKIDVMTVLFKFLWKICIFFYSSGKKIANKTIVWICQYWRLVYRIRRIKQNEIQIIPWINRTSAGICDHCRFNSFFFEKKNNLFCSNQFQPIIMALFGSQ